MHVSTRPAEHVTVLPADFADRLERALDGADRTRRKRAVHRRILAAVPIVLLVGPIIGWRLIMATPDGVHVGIAFLAWMTFLLDVGVHVDTSVLTYLGLSELPTILGALILMVLAGWMLCNPGSER